MPIKTASEIFRDFETDGVPSSGAHKPIKSDIRAWGAQLEGGLFGTEVILTSPGSYTVLATDGRIIVNLAAPGTVALTLGAVAARGTLPVTVTDYAKAAAATITLTPNGSEEIGGRTGAAAWTMTSGGAGMGVSAKFTPNTTLNGWLVGVG